ncbi:DUF1054 domain-containing protein [Paenibacillus chartarius]|uniref:UPF0637 protein ACFFK0_11955 n=1 Tax=Paenibacillus chartarius TaxID=747481 RepID=A0ABV6DKK6_9BACL
MSSIPVVPVSDPFTGFAAEDFGSFHIDGLEPRMEAIRTRIQPKFRAIAAELIQPLSAFAGTELYLHIAKHARRTVNAPVDTWMAFAHDKRGYKQHPHFQIGLFDDHVFVWLAYIYELPNKQQMARRLLDQTDDVLQLLDGGYQLSFDHMKKTNVTLQELGESGWRDAVQRFHDVKKAELLIGRTFPAGSPIVEDGERFIREALQTFETLAPIYRMTAG